MNLATMDDYEAICNLFKQYKDIFPHIRQDYIKRMIEGNKCIYQDGVVITFNIYQRKQAQGHLHAQKGDWVLKQIAIDTQGSGNAKKVVQTFFEAARPNTVWLQVRADNERARRFYEKMGMVHVSDTSWSKGTLKGSVYKYVHKNI